MDEDVRVTLLTFSPRTVTEGEVSSAGQGMVRPTSSSGSWVHSSKTQRCVSCRAGGQNEIYTETRGIWVCKCTGHGHP